MSLLNAWITSAEAIVAVDTAGVRLDGSTIGMSKLVPIVHLPAVLAFRGSSAFSAHVAAQVLAAGFDTFDALLNALEDIATAVDEALPDFMKATVGEIANQFIAAGWSHARSRMVLASFLKRDGEHRFTGREAEGVIAPDVPDCNIPREPGSLERLALAQTHYMQAAAGVGGGTLVIARLTRTGLTITHGAHLSIDEATA